jgi:hypothetical protein
MSIFRIRTTSSGRQVCCGFANRISFASVAATSGSVTSKPPWPSLWMWKLPATYWPIGNGRAHRRAADQKLLAAIADDRAARYSDNLIGAAAVDGADQHAARGRIGNAAALKQRAAGAARSHEVIAVLLLRFAPPRR